MTPALLALAGGLGASCRFLLDSLVSARAPGRFPWGVIVVNVTGSFALGLLVGSDLGAPWTTVLGVGFLGGYTTFSTVSLDAARLSEEGRAGLAALDAAGTLLLCLGAAALGHLVA